MIRHPKTKSIFIGNSFYFTKLNEQEKTVEIALHLDKYIDEEERSEINVRYLKVHGNSIWIGTAKGLFLMYHQEKITKVSKKVGYTTSEYFSKLFKNKYGKNLQITCKYINVVILFIVIQGQLCYGRWGSS